METVEIKDYVYADVRHGVSAAEFIRILFVWDRVGKISVTEMVRSYLTIPAGHMPLFLFINKPTERSAVFFHVVS